MNTHPPIRVGDVMSPTVRTIAGTATVREAINQLRAAGVSSLVVERHDADDEYGLVVISDIARDVIAKDRSPDRVNVYEIMTKPVLTLAPEMDIKYASRLLVEFKLTRALVVDQTRSPIGLVTLRDMVLRHADAEES
jgi:signal-transduction protein with cAMP-binding, CBS, and nucleotidyltransferase domain